MRVNRLFASVVLLGFALILGCGGGSSIVPPPPGASAVSLTMRDAPPTGVTVLSFQVTVMRAVLNPGNVDLLQGKTPKIEIKRLEVETAFLNAAGVTPNTYTSLDLTFANPELTIKNNSGATIAAFGVTCFNDTVCQFKPTGTLTATFNFAAPGLVVTANNPIGLRVDLNLEKILSGTLGVDFSQSGNVIVSTQAPQAGELEDVEDLFGQVKNKGTDTFDLKTSQGTTIAGIKVDSNTKFEDFDKGATPCTPQTFACVKNDQFVEVDARLQATGTLLAKKVEQENEEAIEEEVEGIVTSVNVATNSFQMVLVENMSQLTTVSVGSPVTINVQIGARFQVDQDGLSLNNALINSFAGVNRMDALLLGQNLQVRRKSGTGTTADPVVADRVRLRMSRFTAKVKTKTLPDTFSVDNLPSIFSSATPAITEISVNTFPGITKFESVSGVPALNGPPNADKVSLRGLLFKQPTIPVLAAKKVRKQP